MVRQSLYTWLAGDIIHSVAWKPNVSVAEGRNPMTKFWCK
jgi:hypothetical protein